ncbi:MAG: hypothetical protein FWE42_00200 [Defluviitaleaceae bacterium]|nr:hypothetical protein [Defluviitaleaceae bacterium]
MQKLCDWKLAQKLQASNKRGLIVGVSIGVIVCLVVVGILVKMCWLKKKFDCLHYDLDDMDCDFEDVDDCDCDENGCSYTSDKDFV